MFLFLVNYHHFSTFKNLWLFIQKEKMVEFVFLTANWTWTKEDETKDVKGQFGFVDLNPNFFVIIVKIQQ